MQIVGDKVQNYHFNVNVICELPPLFQLHWYMKDGKFSGMRENRNFRRKCFLLIFHTKRKP